MLLAAVLASMSTGAYAVNPTGSIDVDAGATETVTSIGTSGSASCITKLGEGTAVLDSSLTTVNSTIRVMEGTLKIGDADAVSPSTVAIRTNYDTYYEVLTVGGKDATLSMPFLLFPVSAKKLRPATQKEYRKLSECLLPVPFYPEHNSLHCSDK